MFLAFLPVSLWIRKDYSCFLECEACGIAPAVCQDFLEAQCQIRVSASETRSWVWGDTIDIMGTYIQEVGWWNCDTDKSIYITDSNVSTILSPPEIS